MEDAKLIAPAKINLGLHVVGRRDDGYHEIESVFWPITLSDEITLTPQTSVSVETSWAPTAPFSEGELPQGPENLVYRVLTQLQKAGVPAFQARIVKRIPIGGGLGGGSSNAGTVLRHFVLERPSLSPQELRMALEVGADTPFFLSAKPAWVSGIGEKVAPLVWERAPEYYFLVVCFPKPTFTKQIFDAFRQRGTFRTRATRAVSNETDLQLWLQNSTNSLEEFACEQYPAIGRVLERLKKTKAFYAALSGSGSTCYAVFSQRDARSAAAKDLSAFFRQEGCRSVEADTFNI